MKYKILFLLVWALSNLSAQTQGEFTTRAANAALLTADSTTEYKYLTRTMSEIVYKTITQFNIDSALLNSKALALAQLAYKLNVVDTTDRHKLATRKMIDSINRRINLNAGTTTAGTAPLKFTTQAAGLTTVEQGAMELIGNSLQFTQLAKRRGVMMSQGTIIATTTVANTVTESGSLITAEHGANYLEVGKMEEMLIVGTFSQRNNAAAFATWRIKYAGTTVITITGTAGTAIAAGTPFELRIYGTVRSIGASGTMQINARLYIDGILNNADSQSLVTINTTTAQNTTVTCQWNEANALNILNVHQGAVTCIETNK